MTTHAAPLLECHAISKRFGGEVALEGVDFSLFPGEVHGLVGSNGAGKSTLMKILAGVLPDHQGQVLLDGKSVNLASPQAALSQGIAMVYQELSGVGQLSVAENLFLGRQPTRWGRIDWREMRTKAREYLRELQIDIDVTRRLDSFPLVIRQMVEIARGLHSGARVLILDEPTSALSPVETRRLFQLIAHLKSRQVAVVFISHFIEDVLEICDRVTILRDGRKLETTPAKQLGKQYVIHAMLGQSLTGKTLSEEEVGYTKGAELPPRTATPPVFRARNLSLKSLVNHVSLEVSPGECLGLYGFVGAGHQDLVHILAGAMRASSGTVELDGQPLSNGSTSSAVKRGVVLVAADRQQTVFRRAPIFQNVTLAHLRGVVGEWLTGRREIRVTAPMLQHVGCKPPEPRLLANNLSGGNQQKVVLARWLLGPVRVLLLEEPTRGMDVGAKHEIMQQVVRLKKDGAAVVLASVEPELLLAYADRILVMSRGKIAHEFCGCRVDKATLMRCA